MLRQVIEYANGYKKMSYYTDDKLIKTVAFIFLIICYIVGYFAVWLLLFVTAPVWIIPYCIYTGRKEGNHDRD